MDMVPNPKPKEDVSLDRAALRELRAVDREYSGSIVSQLWLP